MEAYSGIFNELRETPKLLDMISVFETEPGEELILGITLTGQVLGVKQTEGNYTAMFLDLDTGELSRASFNSSWTQKSQNGAVTFLASDEIKHLAGIDSINLPAEIEQVFAPLKKEARTSDYSAKLYTEVEHVIDLYKQTGVVYYPDPSTRDVPRMGFKPLLPLRKILQIGS